ncbi:MAG TPA: hypothetical protein VMZ32_10735 [Gammaproteobacteria bacterium]|nr:hypothetical protein [Gammaproteobacteria bacterium]
MSPAVPAGTQNLSNTTGIVFPVLLRINDSAALASDQGSQYARHDWQAFLKDCGPWLA